MLNATITERINACPDTKPAFFTSVLDFNQHISVLNLQRIHGNLRVGILLGSAGFWIVGPAMPRADDLATFDHSLPQRAAAMETDVVDGAVDAVYIGDADGLFAAGEFFGFVGGWEIGLGGELREVRHLPLSPWT